MMKNQTHRSPTEGKFVNESDDYLTCGRCLTEFPLKRITKFIEHKKLDCETQNEESPQPGLLCSSCPQGFMTAVGLLKHAQFTHNLKLFLEIGPYGDGIQREREYDFQTNSEDAILAYAPVPSLSLQNQEAFIPSMLGTMSQLSPNELQSREAVDMTIKRNVLSEEENVLSRVEVAKSDLAVLPYDNSRNVQNSFNSLSGIQSTISTDVLTAEVRNENLNLEVPTSSFENAAQEILPIKSPTQRKEEFKNDKSCKESEPEICDNESSEVMEESKECCTNQKCGVTVIPGTHEKLKKCCYAVAPKKRKRHMEIKHVPKYWSSRFGKRRTFSSSSSIGDNRAQKPSGRSTGTIYIDLEPETGVVKTSHSSETNQSRSTRMTNIGNSQNFDFQVSGMQRENLPKGISTGQKLSHGSVILGPGTSFSIPVAYTIQTQSSSFQSSEPSNQIDLMTDVTPIMSASNVHDVSNAVDMETTANKEGSTETFQLSSANVESADHNGHHGNEQKESQLEQYGVDVNSLISMALNQMGATQGSENNADISNVTADSGNALMDAESRNGRKRRYPTSKPFKCDQCEHAFNQRIHLKKHMSKHTGIKPFKCQQCDYSTVERSHLKVHIRIHTGEKPFKCTYCEYATAQNSTLKIHLKRHHGRQSTANKQTDLEECSVCGKKVPSEAFQSHVSHHQDGLQSKVDHSKTDVSDTQKEKS